MSQDQGSFEEFIGRYKLPLALSLVGIVLLIGGAISSGLVPITLVKNSRPFQNPSQAKPMVLKVDVSGEVLNPGVYALNNDSRVEEALRAAGGITADADLNFVSKQLNLAQKLQDGMKIYVPKFSDPDKGNTDSNSASSSQININSASAAQLDTLPGIGTATAQKIIDNRPYFQPEDLISKKILSKSSFNKIKDKISV